MKLEDVFPSTLGCCTSIPVFLHSDFPAYPIPLACLSHQYNPPYFSAVIPGSQQRTKVRARAHRHAAIRDCTYRHRDKRVTVLLYRISFADSFGGSSSLETNIIKYGTFLAVLEDAQGTWLSCPDLRRLLCLGKTGSLCWVKIPQIPRLGVSKDMYTPCALQEFEGSHSLLHYLLMCRGSWALLLL